MSKKPKEKDGGPVPEKPEDVVREWQRLTLELCELLKLAAERNKRITILSERIRALEKRQDGAFNSQLENPVERPCTHEPFRLLEAMVLSLENVLAGKPPIVLQFPPPGGWQL